MNGDLGSLSGSEFRTVVCDPPWADLSVSEIIDLEPPTFKQAHLWLWVLNQHVDLGYQVARKWNFEPVQMLTWCKPGLGTGQFQSNTESILVCRKGSRHGNPFGRTGGTWFQWTRGRHSAKPAQFYELVERVSPGPYLEMYARKDRKGWSSFGDEVKQDITSSLLEM